MVSEKQLEANRQNARKSTGPRSAEGKFRASRNAVKHGLTAESVVLPNEDPAEYESRLQEWLVHFPPPNDRHPRPAQHHMPNTPTNAALPHPAQGRPVDQDPP